MTPLRVSRSGGCENGHILKPLCFPPARSLFTRVKGFGFSVLKGVWKPTARCKQGMQEWNHPGLREAWAGPPYFDSVWPHYATSAELCAEPGGSKENPFAALASPCRAGSSCVFSAASLGSNLRFLWRSLPCSAVGVLLHRLAQARRERPPHPARVAACGALRGKLHPPTAARPTVPGGRQRARLPGEDYTSRPSTEGPAAPRTDTALTASLSAPWFTPLQACISSKRRFREKVAMNSPVSLVPFVAQSKGTGMLFGFCSGGGQWTTLSLGASFSGVVTAEQKPEPGPKGGRKAWREGHSTEAFPLSLHHLLNTAVPKHPWRGKKSC